MDEIGLIDYIRMVVRRRWTVIGVTVFVLFITAVVLIFMPRTYQGEAALLFPQQSANTLSSELAQAINLPMLGNLLPPQLTGRDVYYTVLQSRTISENVLRDLHLDRSGVDYSDLQDHLILENPKEGGLIIRCQVPTSWLKGLVPKQDVRRAAAQMASDMTNAYITELGIYDRSNCLFMGRKQRVFVEQQIARTQPDLNLAENRLEGFQKAHPTLIPPENSQEYGQQVMQLTSTQTEADVALNEAKAQLARARTTWKAGAPENISPEAIAQNPAIGDLQLQLSKLEVERATLLENETEKHPDVVSLDQQIAKTYDRLHTEVGLVVTGESSGASPAQQELLKELVTLEVNSDGLEARKAALASAMSHLERQLSGLPADELEYARRIRDVKAAETVYMTLLAERAKAEITEGRDTNNFIILDQAIVPKRPAKPRVKLVLLGAGFLGILLGVCVVIVQHEHPDKRRQG